MNAVRKKAGSLGVFALVALAYFLSGKLGLRLAIVQPNATAVWAPTGIAIAAILLLGYRIWPAIFVAAFAVNVTVAGTIPVSLAIAAGNTLEGAVAAYFIFRFANGVRAFERPQDVFKYSLFAGVLAPMVSATFGVTALALSGSVSFANYALVWVTWWMGDASGALVVAPCILLWFLDPRIKFSREKVEEGFLLAALLFLVAFAGLHGVSGFVYLAVPIFVWGAFRFGQRTTAAAVFTLTGISLWGTLHGLGPFIYTFPALNGALLFLEASMATTFVTMMSLTAAVKEGERNKKKIEEEKAFYDVIISGVASGLFVVDAAEKIILINPRAAAMLRGAPEDFVGNIYYEAIPMQDETGCVILPESRGIAEVLAGRRGGMATEVPNRYYVRKDGSRFSVTAATSPVVRDGRVVGAIVVFSDATKIHQIDQAKSDFISVVSHQLRTPLSVIRLHADLLLKDEGLFETRGAEDYIFSAREIQDAARRMGELMAELSSVSRIDAQPLAVAYGKVDLRKLVEGTFKELEGAIKEKRLRLTAHYPTQLPWFTSDVQLLGIVIQNLVSNAVKYTPPLGEIVFSVVTQGSDIIITVEDTGYGIPGEAQDKIFTKTFRADNVRALVAEGTGLGLYVTKAIVSRLGGTIRFSSVENKGSTFVVQLPID